MRHQNGNYPGHVPVGNYQQSPTLPLPEFHSPYAPQRQLSARQLRRAGLLPEAPIDDMSEFEAEFMPELCDPDLPIFQHREEIKNSIENNQVTIVQFDTSSGKTTQVPKIALQLGRDSITTQPRRFPTYSLADYIATQLEETLGKDHAKGLVGVMTAEQSTVTDQTQIRFITDGIAANPGALMRMSGDRTVLILDEIHERNRNMDMALGFDVLRHAKDSNGRTVIMSATMDPDSIADLYEEFSGVRPNILRYEGRKHPIVKREEPESTVTEQAIQCMLEGDKVIAVILPGKQEIADTIGNIHKSLPKDFEGKIRVVPLHAKMTKQEQDQTVAPFDGTKIICATNVMESSVTIPGLTTVIDSGLARRIYLDGDGNEALYVDNATKAECDQRAGRAARDCDGGKYVLTRLNSDVAFTSYEERYDYPLPEMLRTNIDRVVLRIASEGDDISTFPLPARPNEKIIRQSQRRLRDLGALDENGQITDLGRRMERFPVRPELARMVMAALPYNSHTRAQVAAIAAAVEAGGLADSAGSDWHDLTSEKRSDLLVELDLFVQSQNKSLRQLQRMGLDPKNVKRAREIYAKLNHQIDGWGGDVWSPQEAHREVLIEAIAAGMVNRVYRHIGRGMYELMGGHAEAIPRELSNRSVIKTPPKFVFGTPYTIEFWHDGQLVEKPIIENVTELADPRILGKVAASHLMSWREISRGFRGQGQLKIVQQLIFNGSIAMPDTREIDAEYTPQNQNHMFKHLLEKAGPAQRQLREIKKELETLQRLTPNSLPVITQEGLEKLLKEAMSDGDLDETRIDNRLREIMAERNISLDAIMPPEEREAIRKASPATIMINGHKAELAYHWIGKRSGVPVITNPSSRLILACPDDLNLLDGRRIFFWHEKRRVTLTRMRKSVAEMFAAL